jgi:hypothetical protein
MDTAAAAASAAAGGDDGGGRSCGWPGCGPDSGSKGVLLIALVLVLMTTTCFLFIPDINARVQVRVPPNACASLLSESSSPIHPP